MAPQRRLQKSQQKERACRLTQESYSYPWLYQSGAESCDIVVASPLQFLQLCSDNQGRTWQVGHQKMESLWTILFEVRPGPDRFLLYSNRNFRHFNELEHELLTRLSRAYKPATYYMDIFVSPMATVFARNIAFLSGSVLAVLILLTVWDEDVLNVEHVSSRKSLLYLYHSFVVKMLTIMTVCGALLAGAKVFIPNENLVYCPERTLTQVIRSCIKYYFDRDNLSV